MNTPLPLSVFDEALCFVIAREGGYSDNPADHGGATCCGVTQATYDAFRNGSGVGPRPVLEITPREIRTIYWGRYWRPAACDAIAGTKPNLALVHFDAAVNQGVGEAERMLQRALGVAADGVIGPSTLMAVQVCNEIAAVSALLIERARVYRAIVQQHPEDAQFLPGWLSRLRWCARAVGVAVTSTFA